MGFTVRLPWPPSTNGIYLRGGRRLVLTPYARAYRSAVCGILSVAGVEMVRGPAALTIDLFPPKGKRLMDIDNALKSLIDALQAGRALRNDRDVCRIVVTRRKPVPGGEALVTVEAWKAED